MSLESLKSHPISKYITSSYTLISKLITKSSNFYQTYKKPILILSTIWITTDLIYIYQSRNSKNKWYKYGPLTYIFNRKNGLNSNINEFEDNSYFGIFKNLQFTSKYGLALNMMGGYFLGICLCMGIYEYKISPSMLSHRTTFSLYLIQNSLFYTLEYIWCAIFHPHKLNIDAFIIYTHSKSFHFAMIFSLIEFWISVYLSNIYPQLSNIGNWKQFNKINKYGLYLTIIGQLTRTIAQFTAGKSFTHLVADRKMKEHKLIKNGIYGFIRHPSYFGFFYWSIGSQMLLGNPISFIGCFAASWYFFYDRIPYEEEKLIEFFGDEYREYIKSTYATLIPFLDFFLKKPLKS